MLSQTRKSSSDFFHKYGSCHHCGETTTNTVSVNGKYISEVSEDVNDGKPYEFFCCYKTDCIIDVKNACKAMNRVDLYKVSYNYLKDRIG